MRIENTSDIALPTSHIERRFAVLSGTNQEALASLSWLIYLASVIGTDP
jgi:hypothetical protein